MNSEVGSHTSAKYAKFQITFLGCVSTDINPHLVLHEHATVLNDSMYVIVQITPDYADFLILKS